MTVCAFDGCDREIKARGLCDGHYQQQKRGKKLAPLASYRKVNIPCAFLGCEGTRFARGLCQAHYRQLTRTGELKPIFEPRQGCDFPGCDKPHASKGLCAGHNHQRKQGKELRPLGMPWSWDLEGFKVCPGCSQRKHRDDYNRNKARASGYHDICRDCQRAEKLMYRFKLTPETYEAILALQGGGCALCGSQKSRNGTSLTVDHDHACCPGERSCGKCVRGILCANCNANLERLDTPEAKAYLSGYESRTVPLSELVS